MTRMLACRPLYLKFQTLHQHDAAFVIANVRSNSLQDRPCVKAETVSANGMSALGH